MPLNYTPSLLSSLLLALLDLGDRLLAWVQRR